MTMNQWSSQLDFANWPSEQKQALAQIVKKQIDSTVGHLQELTDVEPISLSEESKNRITDRVIDVIQAGNFAADVVTLGTVGVAHVFSALLNPIFRAAPSRSKTHE